MTIHYHGTPISPISAFYEMSGRCFCVSYAAPQDVARAHELGQSVMLDNGAFSAWKRGYDPNWGDFYKWSDVWLDCPTTWAVIPDVIDGGSQIQDALIKQWPHGDRGAPVWHMDEPLDRLIRLTHEWPRVCIGSTGEFSVVMDEVWERKMDEIWEEVMRRHKRPPNIHMLRGMQCSGKRWPFASLDSTDIAQNHHRPQNTPRKMADRWDAMQCSINWAAPAPQLCLEFLEGAA
jgi:hypothetical protein